MASRYRALVLYSALLAAGMGWWLAGELAGAPDFPAPWVVVLAIAANLFVWQFGVPAPRVGLASMERVPQIGLLLILSPPVAATICAAASLLWPLINRAYSQHSLKVAMVRGLHNSAMTALMLLAAGEVYLAAGGRHPLDRLSLEDVPPLVGMALTAQAVNVVLLALFFWLDGRDVRHLIRPIYSAVDLLFVPAGVLAAVLYSTAEPGVFALFAALMVVFVFSFNGLGRALSAADTQSAQLARLSGPRRALHGARHIAELGERILTETRALFRFDEFCLALVDRERRLLDIRVQERNGQRLPARSVSLDESLYVQVVDRAQPLLVEDWAHAPADLQRQAAGTGEKPGSVIAVPLMEEGAVIGLLAIQHSQAAVYSDADLNVMRGLGEEVAAAVADARAFEELEDYRRHLEQRVAERTRELEKANIEKERLIAALGERSRTLERESQEDPLTGIANRRCFAQRLETEIDVALAIGQPLTLAVADLDHFKAVNDHLGHAVGDEVLRQGAALMRQHCRATDLVARIGGEEFALILPGMTRGAAVGFCESLRRAFETHDWRAIHPHLHVTLSIGIAQWDGVSDAAQLLQAADAQLYRAKHTGRNRVA